MNATDLIKQFEGLRLTAYQDQGGVWTIGYGSTGPDIGPGLVWTQEQADQALEARVQLLGGNLWRALPMQPQFQLEALTSLCYNIGYNEFLGSTLHHKLLARAPLAEIEFEWKRWNHVGGVEDPGLTKRREAEWLIYSG